MITDQKALCRDVPETPLVLWALVDSLSSRWRKPPWQRQCHLYLCVHCQYMQHCCLCACFVPCHTSALNQRTTSVCVDQLCFGLINHRDGRKSKKKCQFDVFVALYLMRMAISGGTLLQDNRHIVGKPERSRRINSDSFRRLF